MPSTSLSGECALGHNVRLARHSPSMVQRDSQSVARISASRKWCAPRTPAIWVP
jgi:hypothetical protein